MKKSKLKIIIASVAVGLVAIVGTLTFNAIFQSNQKADTSVTTGIVNVDLKETFPEADEFGAPMDSVKTIWGENTGTQKAYVRVKLFPVVEVYDDIYETWNTYGAVSTSFIKYDLNLNDSWIYDETTDYYYYKEILDPSTSTQQMIVENLRIEAPNIIQSKYIDGYTLRINLLVQLESCQASNELYKLNWGIDSLPSGVESYR